MLEVLQDIQEDEGKTALTGRGLKLEKFYAATSEKNRSTGLNGPVRIETLDCTVSRQELADHVEAPALTGR